MTPLQKLPKNVGDLGKLIASKGFKKLPKVQKIAQSDHTDYIIKFPDAEPSYSFKTWSSLVTGLLFNFPIQQKDSKWRSYLPSKCLFLAEELHVQAKHSLSVLFT